MSISTLESRPSRIALAAIHLAADELARDAAYLNGAFMRAALAGDMAADAQFASRVRATSVPTVAEVLTDSLDYTGGPELAEVLGLLTAAAKGVDVTAASRELLVRMANAWALQNAEAA